jgi:hypothetical protein
MTYTARPRPVTNASVEAVRKRKTDAYDKPANKRAKVAAKEKFLPSKATAPNGKSSVKRHSDMELALAKAVKKSKWFSPASSTVPTSVPGCCRGVIIPRPSAPAATPTAPGADPRVELISMLGLVSFSGSHESSSSDSRPSRSDSAPHSTANPAISSAMVVPQATQLQAIASDG